MLWSFSLNLSLVIGPAVAGVLIASFGGPSVLLIDAGIFAVMAIMAGTLPTLKRSNGATEVPISERFGLRQLWDMKVVRYTTLLQRNVPKAQRGRVFGARSTLLIGGMPLGLATGGILLAFVPSTGVIALSAFACILVGLSGLASPTLRGLVLPAAGPGA